ncbi:MAG: hypothetical protein Q9202_004629 [Teloschistes flavicans]
MFLWIRLAVFLLFGASIHALPASSGIPSSSLTSGQGVVIATAPFPTATGPTCIQTRSPGDPSGSHIGAAVQQDDSISKACNVNTQQTITTHNGLLSVTYIYYALDSQYFFNISHSANVVVKPPVSPDFCPDIFNSIFSTCITSSNFWGGWVLNDGVNRSIATFVYAVWAYRFQFSLYSGSFQPRLSRKSSGTVSKGQTVTPSDASTSARGSSRHDKANTAPIATASKPSVSENSGDQQPTSNGEASSGQARETNSAPATGRTPTSSKLPASQRSGGQPPATEPHTGGPSNTRASSQQSIAPLPPGATVIYTTINSQTYSETFIPTTYSALATLVTTLTTSTLDVHSSFVPLVIGPGGIAWTPLAQPSGTAANLSPPTVLPTIANLPGLTTAAKGSSAAQSSVVRSHGTLSSNGVPSKTPVPGTSADTHPSGAPLAFITTSYDPEASTVTSIGPEITGNTAIRTSDDHHGLGFYPFWKGGPHCFIICPPGIDNGGIILWGMDKPGIYPPPTPPPFPGIEWPTITIDNDLEPTATEEPDDEPSNSRPDESAKSTANPTAQSTGQSTAETTAKPSSTTQSSARSSSHSNSYSTGIQKYILSIETVGIDELKERNSWMVKYHHLGGASGATSSGSARLTGINTKTSDNTVYSICAGDPFPTIASSTLEPVKTTAPAKPKPSEAIIVYREDSCDDVDCSSLGHVYEITPGQPVDPCKDDDIYSRAYTQGAANDDSDYPVNLGPFKAHNIDGLKYSGSNNHVGTLTGNIPGSPIQCIVPAAQATSCTSSHSLDADDFIPIVYCEW